MSVSLVLNLVNEKARLGDVAQLLAKTVLISDDPGVVDLHGCVDPSQRTVNLLMEKLGLPKQPSRLEEVIAQFSEELLDLALHGGLPVWHKTGAAMIKPGVGGYISVRKVLSWLQDGDRPHQAALIAAIEAATSGQLRPGSDFKLPAPRWEKQTDLQNHAVIAALQRRGVDPLDMPQPPLGNKPWPLREELGKELGYSKATMKKTFTRLRDLKLMSTGVTPGRLPRAQIVRGAV